MTQEEESESTQIASRESTWPAVISAVRTPLGFFSLVVLMIEAALVPLMFRVTEANQLYLLAGFIGLPVLLIALVAGLAAWRPEALHGIRPPSALPPRPLEGDAQATEHLALEGGRDGAEDMPLRPEKMERIQVSNAEQFIEAIGSDRIIEIVPGTIDLGDARDRYLKYVRWERNHDGHTVTIRNVSNLHIVGAQRNSARILVVPAYTYVLAFEDCEGIELRGLTLGHAPSGGCTGGVVAVKNCEQFRVVDCKLFGCGTEGLTAISSRAIRLERSEVFDCTYGIATITGCRDVEFRSSKFHHNRQFHGFVINDCEYVEFIDSEVIANTSTEPLFQVTSSWPVRFRGGKVVSNTCPSVGAGVDFSSTEVAHNRAS